MGSGIAAHLANLGFDVTLLDLTQASVESGFERARQARPPHFYVKETASNVRLGSIEHNLDWIAEADWVCEAIIERLDAKQSLFEAIEPHLRPDAMISTNTSGIEIALLAEGRSESFRERFMGTHFFNPPRYLKLLELIPNPDTLPPAVEAMTRFLEDRVGRRVVLAKDTPGFIANRFGMWSMFHAIHTAEKLDLSIEQVDAITGPFLGRPKSGSFRLNDLVGLDIMQDIGQNLVNRCPNDPHCGNFRSPRSMVTLLERGWIGEKSGQGYYRREGREFVALDFRTLAYRQRQDPDMSTLGPIMKLPLGERVRQALEMRNEIGEFLRNHLLPVLRYADYLAPEISYSVQDFDRVMKWGFGWEMGPFEMIDAIGHDVVGVRDEPYYRNAEVRGFDGAYISLPDEPQYKTVQDFEVIEVRDGFNVRDLGDGVSALCLTTKMGTINPSMIKDMIDLLKGDSIRRFVLTSEGRSYSAGFDLSFFIDRLNEGNVGAIDEALINLQTLGLMLAERPGVAAVYGHCLGAGLELAMNCSIVAAHPETQIGLPEAKVGLLPGGGGTALMRLRNQSSARTLADTALMLTLGTIASGPDEARRMGYLRGTDMTVYHPDRLITEAKELALTVQAEERPEWTKPEGPLVGMIDRLQEERKARGELSDHDELIGDKIKAVFAKTSSFDEALARERQEFLELCLRALTVARIRHMLDHGKPLRN
jgi:3-hydroxyacyl-CoA dehydrogenase